MTSPPETICGRCLRTDSRTFSSCRNQSRAPRENRSYHFAASAPALPPAPLVLGPTLGPESVLGAIVTTFTPVASRVQPRRAVQLLLREQCRNIAERLFRAVFVITVLRHEALLHDRNLLSRVLVRPSRRGDEPQHIATLFEQILLDGLAHARVAGELELLTGLEGHHGLTHHFLSERELAGVRDLDLLLDRAQEALIGRTRLAR